MQLRGQYVLLRPLQREDLERRIDMVNDPEVQRLTIGMPVDENTEFDVLSWFQLVSDDPHSEQWAIVDLAADEYIGDIDLHSIRVMGNEAWISPMFGTSKARSNKALRLEAIGLIVDYAFREKNVEAVRIDIPDADEQGIEILKELGFELEEAYEFDMFTGAQTLTYVVTPANFQGDIARRD